MTRINTRSHESTRISLGRLIRSYQKNELDSQTFRDLVYSLNLLLAFFKFQSDEDLAKRLEAIEAKISEVQLR